MRVTNKMIMNNAGSNINTTKEFVNIRNKQMTSQKKIDKPSDDPVIAVRSLRLSTTLSQVTQYYEKNIPDASQWIRITETALINMRDIVKDCKEISNSGATDTKNSQDDRQTLLTQLEALQKQLFAEGNADYANRTVFTGYRTDRNLTFTEDEAKTKYQITQVLSVEERMEEKRYYDGNVLVPTTKDEVLGPAQDPPTNTISDIVETDYYRIRLNYDDIDGLVDNSLTITYQNGTVPTTDVKIYANETEWSQDQTGKNVPDNTIVIVRETGDIIFANNLAADFKAHNASLTVNYEKTGFDKGELRPEYYYNCKMLNDATGAEITKNNEYVKFDENGNRIHFDIEYTIAANQTIAINTEASDVFDSSIQRDVNEMIDAVKKAMNAYDKIQKIKSMKDETQYAGNDEQKWLDEWQTAAQKEFDFYSNNMRKLFDTEIGKMTEYYDKISLAITDLGCKEDSLKLTENRVGDQQQTVQGLQSKNDDIELSQIIIEYTAAYTAYQASLTAAGKLGDSTLLNYI